MTLPFELLAGFGFLLPVFLWVFLRSSREREAWQFALDIPTAIALDLLIVLTLSLIFRLETAAFISRAVYIALGAAYLGIRIYKKYPLPAWPQRIGFRALLLIGTGTLAALLISMWMSRTWVIWDRGWHIPLVASIRGQSLPFFNAFNTGEPFRYHFSGDVHAAVLQTLSLGVLHSSLALSLAHDLHFGLTGLVLSLFLCAFGYRLFSVHAVFTALLLLTGPAHLFRERISAPQEGHSLVSFLSFSFRPSTGLSVLLLLGIIGAVLVRLGSHRELPWQKTAPALCLIAAGLAITDETSLGLFGLTLGLVWLFAPRTIHQDRRVGIVVFAALLAALILPNLAFSAGLSPGGESLSIHLTRPRTPGYYRPTLTLNYTRARLLLVHDLFAPLMIGLGGLLHIVFRRTRGRTLIFVFYLVWMALSVIGLTCIDINGAPHESHRFAMALMIVAPFFAMALLAKRFPFRVRARGKSRLGPVVMVIGLVYAASSTLDWGIRFAPAWAARHVTFGGTNFYNIDCRDVVGNSLGARPQYLYVESSFYYLVTGCYPTYTPAYISDSAWKTMTIGLPHHGEKAIEIIGKTLPKGAAVPMICPAKSKKPEAVCAVAKRKRTCVPLGPMTVRCEGK